MSRIWFDTEFVDNGKTIELISIGMVSSDDREYYREVEGCDLSGASEWVVENVVSKLTGDTAPREVIADQIKEFAGESPEFWAHYGSYDWVALCQLYGPMIGLPDGWPMFCRDAMQLRAMVGEVREPDSQNCHNALDDARWLRDYHSVLESMLGRAAL